MLGNPKKSTELVDVLNRYCSGLDDAVSNRFYTLFGEEYKTFIKAKNSKF